MTTRDLVETLVYATGIPSGILSWIFTALGCILTAIVFLTWVAVCLVIVEYTKRAYGWFPQTHSLFGESNEEDC